MGRDHHFSLDNLPARYREQAARQLVSKPKPAPKKRAVSPIRVKKNASGMNKTEEKFNREVLLGLGKYEAITFHLSGGAYTPDFYFVNPDTNEICLIEVKGSYRLGSQGRSVFAFKQASAEYPQFRFMFAKLADDGRTWTIGTYRGDKEISCVSGTAQELRAMK